jgi:glyoxylase-like metal-dependent hydrolase (beta-lactamase superfamily II)
MRPQIQAFFDKQTKTISYVLKDPESAACAIIDSVLDFDAAAGRTATKAADAIIAFVREHRLAVEWILETHVHADHLTAAAYLKERLGGTIGIGAKVRVVQNYFGDLFNAGPAFKRNGSQFDRLFDDGAEIEVGRLAGRAIDTPGHTPGCVTYVFDDAAFIGDTLFMPDYGTARCDFPGGDARQLYRSIQRIFALAPQTRLFMCHDYPLPERTEYRWESTVAEEKAHNVQVHDGVAEDEFVAMRTRRDATLAMPQLIIPSVQVNMRAGQLPPPEENGVRYLKVPIDKF